MLKKLTQYLLVSYFALLAVIYILWKCGLADVRTKIIFANYKNLFIVGFVAVGIYLFYETIIVSAKKGYKNISDCDDELFKTIDNYKVDYTYKAKHRWFNKNEDKPNNHYYYNMIKIVNYVYRNGGVIDQVDNEEERVRRLFKRLTFLENNNKYSDLLNTCVYSFTISILATVVTNAMGLYEAYEIIIIVLLITILAIMIILMNFDRNWSFKDDTRTYEIKLLREKLSSIEDRLYFTNCEELIFNTKSALTHEIYLLMNNEELKKSKKKLKKIIEEINNIDLDISSYSDYKVKEFYIRDSHCCLICIPDIDITKHFTEEYLINDQYKKLYRMLQEYHLIDF